MTFAPGDRRCLARALVLTALLARRGIETRFLIGVRPGAGFGAHAWLECEGKALLPSGGDQFRELVSL